MKEFASKDLSKLLDLNSEYVLATPARRAEIEQEIIALAPKEIFPPSLELLEMSKLQELLKEELLDLINNSEGADLESYYARIQSLVEKTNEYALRLGVSIPETDLGKSLQTLLQIKFPTN